MTNILSWALLNSAREKNTILRFSFKCHGYISFHYSSKFTYNTDTQFKVNKTFKKHTYYLKQQKQTFFDDSKTVEFY